ncbi:hypothetical protein HZH68_007592 [Vespula germanica]|uniref:Uncharacterized protein n=1 Tax=Vespula germanica TaxID=30212 RepID=A0A834K9B1_VESGE|nr:hypothetical protein HZH68_007592 [Vespula germanica]
MKAVVIADTTSTVHCTSNLTNGQRYEKFEKKRSISWFDDDEDDDEDDDKDDDKDDDDDDKDDDEDDEDETISRKKGIREALTTDRRTDDKPKGRAKRLRRVEFGTRMAYENAR